MAEIEHFVKPTEKNHPKFSTVSSLVLNFLPAPPKVLILIFFYFQYLLILKNNIKSKLNFSLLGRRSKSKKTTQGNSWKCCEPSNFFSPVSFIYEMKIKLFVYCRK